MSLVLSLSLALAHHPRYRPIQLIILTKVCYIVAFAANETTRTVAVEVPQVEQPLVAHRLEVPLELRLPRVAQRELEHLKQAAAVVRA